MDQESEGGAQNFIDSWRYDIEEFNAADIPVEDHQDPVVFRRAKWDSYNRVNLCTNLPALFQVCSKSPRVGETLKLHDVPVDTVLTQKHLLVSHADGKLNWFKIEPPYDNEKEADMHLKLFEKIEKEYNFAERLPEDCQEPASIIHYSRSHAKMLIGTASGLVAALPIAAEKSNFDDDEVDDGEEKPLQTLDDPLQELGRFHTGAILAIRPLGDSTQFATISADHTVSVWEATTHTVLSHITMPVMPASLDVSQNGTVMFVGTEAGTFRIYDISDRSAPRILKQMKFFEEKLPISNIQCSLDGKLVLISSRESDTFFVMSQQAEDQFDIYGYVQANGLVLSTAFEKHEGKMCSLVVLSNNLVEKHELPVSKYENRLEPMPDSVTNPAVRKIDSGSDLIVGNVFLKKHYVLGKDGYLKEYEHFPSDKFKKVNWNMPPVPPGREFESHSLGTTCVAYGGGGQCVVTGGRDGTIIIRDGGDMEQSRCIQAHSVVGGGITAIGVNRGNTFAYTAGADGSVCIYAIGNDSYPKQAVSLDNKNAVEAVAKVPTAPEALPIDKLMSLREIMIFEFNKSNEARKDKFKKEIMGDLVKIRNKLQELLAENERVTDIERLERDEFVIDTEKRDHFEQQGENVCAEIRN